MESLFCGNFIFQFVWMTIMYLIYVTRKNGSMVDFGWPSGFFLMALAHLVFTDGYWLRSALICGLYMLAGARFMFGWTKRGHLAKEDSRWILWRELWRDGKGMFGIRNEYINSWMFYHAQSMANAIFFIMPLQISCSNPEAKIHCLEVLGVIIWFFSFWLENKADFQRLRFVTRQRDEKKPWGAIVNDGLWKYSRHPNYFCEFLIWVAYTIYSIPSVKNDWRTILLFFVPYVAYYFLVKFTGIYITEQSMLKKRKGTPFEKEYENYLKTTSEFFPWFNYGSIKSE